MDGVNANRNSASLPMFDDLLSTSRASSVTASHETILSLAGAATAVVSPYPRSTLEGLFGDEIALSDVRSDDGSFQGACTPLLSSLPPLSSLLLSSSFSSSAHDRQQLLMPAAGDDDGAVTVTSDTGNDQSRDLGVCSGSADGIADIGNARTLEHQHRAATNPMMTAPIARQHPSVVGTAPSALLLEAESFACDTCGRVLKNDFSLRRHKVLHLPVRPRPFSCVTCGKTFAQNAHLKKHFATHK